MDVGFEAAEYSIIESEGAVMVCVGLTGRMDIPVDVEFSVRDPPGRNQGNPVTPLLLCGYREKHSDDSCYIW